jgi:8-oxo-dGTP diphosphatase
MIDVTCAIIRNEEEEILVVQRGEASDHPFKWEFPGGKVHPGESAEDSIIREIMEELSLDIIITGRIEEVEHDYGFRQIKLIPFICDTLDEFPLLAEHIAYKWIAAADLESVDFCEADIVVASRYLESNTLTDVTTAGKIDDRSQVLSDDKELRKLVGTMMRTKEAEWMAGSAVSDQAVLGALLEFSFSDDSRLAFHASWTLTKACDLDPGIIYPYLDNMVEKLENLGNESALRSILRIISLTDIDRISKRNHGILADRCFSLLRSGFSAVAVKVYSMEILYKLVLKYPELRNELSSTIVLLQAEGSAGILARGRQILKKLASPPTSSPPPPLHTPP